MHDVSCGQGSAVRKARAGVVVLAMVAAACTPTAGTSTTSTSDFSSTVPTTTPSSTTSTIPTTAPSSTTTPPNEHVTVYYLLDDVGEVNRPGPSLVPVDRIAASDDLAATLQALLDGPTQAQQQGVPAMSSAIPVGTSVLGVSVADGVATVDLSNEFESGGGSFSVMARLAQVVYTATRSESVGAVSFQVEGESVTTFSSEGLVLDGPQTRTDYQDFIPMIFLDQPTYGGPLGNPAHLEGEAAVFEAVFQAVITDSDGLIIAEPPYLMTTNGMGWGTFDATIPYQVDEPQWGSVIVWEDSAKDGSQINIREYPVWLSPAP